MRLANLFLRLYPFPILGQVARVLWLILGTDIPRSVEFGRDVAMKHRGLGVVMNPKTTIGDRVAIFHQVTLGQADVNEANAFGGITIEDRAVIGAGAKILAPAQGLTVGKGTVIGANAVLTESTGQWEVWAGVPARMVARRSVADPTS